MAWFAPSRRPLALLVTLLLQVGCGGRTQQALGGESNWLQACSADADCGAGTCLCSVCTDTCDGERDCSERGGGACVAPAALDAESCPGVVPDQSVCLPALGESQDARAPGGQGPNGSGPDAETPLGEFDAEVDAPVETSAERSECAFEFLGYWARCSDTQDEEPVAGAASSIDCMIACQQTPDCVGFNENFWMGDDATMACHLVRGDCDSPMAESYYEEDGARGFRIRCDEPAPTRDVKSVAEWQPELGQAGLRVTPDSECVFSLIGDSDVCENFGLPEFEPERYGSLQECLDACDAMPECTAVVDWWGEGPTDYECVLYTSSCDSPYRSLDELKTLVKRCDP